MHESGQRKGTSQEKEKTRVSKKKGTSQEKGRESGRRKGTSQEKGRESGKQKGTRQEKVREFNPYVHMCPRYGNSTAQNPTSPLFNPDYPMSSRALLHAGGPSDKFRKGECFGVAISICARL